jgi:hypothetical protein
MGCIAIPDGAMRSGEERVNADVLTVGEINTVLRPVLDAIDGCGWTVRYRPDAVSAADWLHSNRALLMVMEADCVWRDALACFDKLADGPRLILITRGALPVEEMFRLGVHDVLRFPLDSYNLRWSLVTAWQEAHSGRNERGYTR